MAINELPAPARKEIAEAQVFFNVWVAGYGVRDDLLDYVREAESVSDAIDRAKEAMAELKAPTGKTLADVYALTGEEKCPDGTRWDPITQTCVPE